MRKLNGVNWYVDFETIAAQNALGCFLIVVCDVCFKMLVSTKKHTTNCFNETQLRGNVFFQDEHEW